MAGGKSRPQAGRRTVGADGGDYVLFLWPFGQYYSIIYIGCTMQFFAYIMWSSVYAYTPELYPTRLRATGCGMASSIGRLGALLGPTVVGLVLAAYGSGTVFSMAAVVFGVGALAVFILGVETKGKALEAISN